MKVAVIMAGGQGQRFWPLTKPEFPKYRLRFNGEHSLLQKTYQRLKRVYRVEDIFVVTTRDHARIISLELKGFPKKNIIIEPARNNTACAIYLASRILQKRYDENTVCTFFPADHLIENVKGFAATLKIATNFAAKKNALVTIGVTPDYPATGFGYIQCNKGGPPVKRAIKFKEKPDLKTAKEYIRRGGFYWNGGIFSWRIRVFLDTLNECSPGYDRIFDINNIPASYKKMPSLSIDYALMEKAPNVWLCPARMDWCDLGSWDMFYKRSPKDRHKNVVFGPCVLKNVKNSLIMNYTQTLLKLSGLTAQVIVVAETGVLMCELGNSEETTQLKVL